MQVTLTRDGCLFNSFIYFLFLCLSNVYSFYKYSLFRFFFSWFCFCSIRFNSVWSLVFLLFCWNVFYYVLQFILICFLLFIYRLRHMIRISIHRRISRRIIFFLQFPTLYKETLPANAFPFNDIVFVMNPLSISNILLPIIKKRKCFALKFPFVDTEQRGRSLYLSSNCPTFCF